MGVWGRYLPNIQDSLGLSDSLLGTSVLFVYLGTVLVSPMVAALLKRFASRVTTIIGQWSFIGSLPFIALANSFGLLTFVMFVYGFAMGIMDISMNNSAILTEIVASKPLLGSFHGSYSVAAALGSLLGGLLIQWNISTLGAFLGLAIVAFLCSASTCFHMYDSVQETFLIKFHEMRSKHAKFEKSEYEAVTSSLLADSEQQQAIENPVHEKDSRQTIHIHKHKGNVYDVRELSPAHNNEEERINQEIIDDDITLRSTVTEFISAERLFAANHRGTTTTVDNNAQQPLLRHSTTRDSIDKKEEEGELVGHREEEEGFSLSGLYKARKVIAYFSAVGFLAAFGESGIVTWSTSYFERYISDSSVIQSLGFTSFMVCMAVGRFCCDYLRQRFGRTLMVRVGGILASLGLVIVVLSVDLPIPEFFASAGFACTGLGLSTLIPTIFSSAGHLPEVHAGTAIATVAGFSYSGSIVSSPLIGLLSDCFGSLRYALLFDAVLMGLIFPLSWGIIPESKVFMKGGYEQRKSTGAVTPA